MFLFGDVLSIICGPRKELIQVVMEIHKIRVLRAKGTLEFTLYRTLWRTLETIGMQPLVKHYKWQKLFTSTKKCISCLDYCTF